MNWLHVVAMRRHRTLTTPVAWPWPEKRRSIRRWLLWSLFLSVVAALLSACQQPFVIPPGRRSPCPPGHHQSWSEKYGWHCEPDVDSTPPDSTP